MKYTLFLILLIVNTNSFGQKALGQWTEYLSYRSVHDIVEGNNVIYAACENSLFSLNRSDNSISRYSSVNGLSDKNITSIDWSESNSTLLVGYGNGNIDFLSDEGIFNFSDIKRSSITSDKSIYSFYNDGDFVWICTGFGIVKINLVAQEVVETYIIGEGGSETRVNNVVHNNGMVYAATQSGIYHADLNSSLQDFNNWTLLTDLPTGNYGLVFNLGGNLGAFLNDDTTKQVYRRVDGTWQMELDDTNINDVYVSNDHLLILRYNWLRIKDSNLNNVLSIDDYDFTDKENFIFGFIDADGKAWIGDGQWGLVEHIEESSVNNYQPDGPSDNTTWRVDAIDDELWVAHGGVTVQFSASYKRNYFSGITNNSWQKFAQDGVLSEDSVVDVVDVAINPLNTSQVFFGSWIGGLVEKKTDGNLEVYKDFNGNSLIHRIGDSGNYRVGGITFDNQGNLWMTNSNDASEKQLLVRKSNGDEKVFDCLDLGTSIKIGEIIHTSNNQLWVLNHDSPDGKIFMYDYSGTIDNANDDQCMKINTNASNGGLPTNNVLSIAEDLDGEIWIGTTEGPAIIYTPEFLFENNPPQAQQIKVEQDGNVEIVLSTSSISTIAVDGANRKWLGTTSSGAFLLSEDGTETILHFTTENSPLLENSIRHISINDKTGEVFFATDEGLFSYLDNATLGQRDNECFSVFPNPVRPDYKGPIAIDGLVRDSQVKITDISGNLVYETVSNGGRAIWDGTNFSGQRVQSGVYLALITSIANERESSCISKIMIIN